VDAFHYRLLRRGTTIGLMTIDAAPGTFVSERYRITSAAACVTPWRTFWPSAFAQGHRYLILPV
jgi:hypothetical protein